jgi:hypothetical protein
MENLSFARTRRQVKYCPCGKSNRDGKFAPFLIEGKAEEQYGYCHSCSQTFLPEDKQQNSSCYDNTSGNRSIFSRNQYACYGSKSHNKASGYSNDCGKTASRYGNKSLLIEEKLVKNTLKAYETNSLAAWLRSVLPEKAESLLRYFHIGTAKDGSTLFWYRDCNGYRTVKKMRYRSDGHRDRSSFPVFLFKKSEGYIPCLYGEFQLELYPKDATVILLESEKSTVIAHAFYPQYLWLATGGASALTEDKAAALKGRKVVILPDSDKAGREAALKSCGLLKAQGCTVLIKDLFPDCNDGSDIADFLLTIKSNH